MTSTVRNKAGFPIRSFCRSCGEDFSGDRMFEFHRTGVHEYTHAEGLAMEPPRENGRRCLDAEEMEERGWRRDARGRWIDPVRVSQARRGFPGTTEKASNEEEA